MQRPPSYTQCWRTNWGEAGTAEKSGPSARRACPQTLHAARGRLAPVQAPAGLQPLAVHLCRQCVAAQLGATHSQGGVCRCVMPAAAAPARCVVGGCAPGVGIDQQGTIWLASYHQVVLQTAEQEG